MNTNQNKEEFEARKRAYESKRQARIERLQRKAANFERLSNSNFREADRMASAIPMGQPILVGHHSERSDRNYRSRIHRKMDKAVEFSHKASRIADKAEAAIANKAISSDDPEAITRLKSKLDRLLKERELINSINKIVRSKKVLDKQKALEEIGVSSHLSKEALTPDYSGKLGVPSWVLSNLSGNIKNVRDRIEQLEKIEAMDEMHKEIKGIRIEEDKTENRLRIYFNGKPSDVVIKQLKSCGFKWAPSQQAWQRRISPISRRQAESIIEKNF